MRQIATAIAFVFTMCAVAQADPPERQRDSPHVAPSIHVFVTPEGEQPLRDGAVEYPLGTILLKQKINGVHGTELYTGMLKREPGYNPACGDWEFFTLSGDVRRVTARGRIDSCMECHLEYEETGFVARDYLIDSRPRRTVATRQSNEIVQADRAWRDADLVTIARARYSTMIRVTEDPYDDLNEAEIMRCAAPDNQYFGRLQPDYRRASEVVTDNDPFFYFGSSDLGRMPRILQSIETATDLRGDAGISIVRTEERIFVTSNNQIEIDPLQPFRRPLLPPPGVTSEFFGTIGETPGSFLDGFNP